MANVTHNLILTGDPEHPYKMVHPMQQPFLDEYARIGNVTKAAATVHIGRQTVYRWLQEDDRFNQAFLDASRAYGDVIRGALHDRGIDGVKKLVLYKGRPVLDKQGNHVFEYVYSDTILAMMARSHLPEYKDQSQEGKAQPLGEHSLVIPDVRKLSQQVIDILVLELERIQTLEHEEMRRHATQLSSTIESDPDEQDTSQGSGYPEDNGVT